MRTNPLDIDGLAGPVVITTNAFTGKNSIMVGGRPAAGSRRGGYQLPTADGRTVPAKLRTSPFDPYPSLEIGGVRHRTGPAAPMVLRVLAFLPLVLVVGGLIGGVVGASGWLVNMGIARSSQSTAVKAVLMIVVLAVAVVVWLILAAAFRTAVDGV